MRSLVAPSMRKISLPFVHSALFSCALITCLAGATGCSPKVESEVVLRSTVDQEVAAPILAAFHRSEQKQIQPRATFGSAKTTSAEFVSSLESSQADDADDDDRGDVIWTDNMLLMIELQRGGLLQSHAWKVDPGFPTDMRADDKSWCGFAAVARVLIVNTERLPDPNAYPNSIEDLADPRWNQRCAIASPVDSQRRASANAAMHAALIGHAKGIEGATDWFGKVAQNAVVMSTNSEVATAVAAGKVDWGLTDSSDAVVERDAGNPVAIIFPDQATHQAGAIRIPHAVAVLKNPKHPIAATRLADYLVLPSTEDRLAMSDASQIPLSRTATFRPRVLADSPVRWANIDMVAAERTWQVLEPVLVKIFADAP